MGTKRIGAKAWTLIMIAAYGLNLYLRATHQRRRAGFGSGHLPGAR